MERITQTQKAQGGTEYLVVMSVVLGIALICVALLVWPIETTKDAKKQQTDIHFKINEIGTQVEDDNYQSIMQGLVAYWKFDEGSGTSAIDSRGGNTGTLTGGPTWISGKSGQALHFDGVNDLVAIAGSFGGGSEITLSAWIKSDGDAGTIQAVVSPTLSEFVHFQILTAAGVHAVYTNAGSITVSSPSPAPYSIWKHIAITAKSGEIRSYVDGIQNGSASNSFSTITSTSDLHIGSGLGSRWFNGTIDEVMIFNRALSASEILLLYENPGYPQ